MKVSALFISRCITCSSGLSEAVLFIYFLFEETATNYPFLVSGVYSFFLFSLSTFFTKIHTFQFALYLYYITSLQCSGSLHAPLGYYKEMLMLKSICKHS